MEIGNRADAYPSVYYPAASANNRQAVSEIEQARAQQERERERTAATNESESLNNEENQIVVDSSTKTLQADFEKIQYEQQRFYAQHAELDRSSQQALETYQRVAHQDDHSLEILHRIDVLA